MGNVLAERWVTIQEATGLIGKSERTIRRWVETDKLAHRREGRRIMVNVAELAPPISQDILDIGDLDMLRLEVARLRGDLAGLERQVGQLESERDYLRGQNTWLLQLRRPAIEQPKERSWWQFWKSD